MNVDWFRGVLCARGRFPVFIIKHSSYKVGYQIVPRLMFHVNNKPFGDMFISCLQDLGIYNISWYPAHSVPLTISNISDLIAIKNLVDGYPKVDIKYPVWAFTVDLVSSKKHLTQKDLDTIRNKKEEYEEIYKVEKYAFNAITKE